MNIEWRHYAGNDAIVLVDPSTESVREISQADGAVLKDYLAVTGNMDSWRRSLAWQSVKADDSSPDQFGELVLSRTETGDISFVDPELFWEGVQRWFRSKGVDYASRY